MKSARTLFAIALMSASALAFGQAGQKSMSVRVPFAFAAAGKTLPAGHYIVSEASADGITSIRDDAGKHTVLFLTNVESYGSPASASKLVFLHAGEDYRLQKVAYRGSGTERRLWQEKKSREIPTGAPSQMRTIVADF